MRNLVFKAVSPIVSRGTGICDRSALLDITNEAQERLLNRKDAPVGALVPYRFCSKEHCLVLPRQVVAVEGYSVCGVPGTVLPVWYTHHANGPGAVCHLSGCGGRAIDQGTVVSFENVHGNTDGTGNYIRVYAQSSTDVGKRIILKYYRADTRAPQYTSYDGAVQEGEAITLVAPPSYAITTRTVMRQGLYGAVKDITEYPINLYEYNGLINLRMLAWYEPGETIPIYRKMYLPGLSNVGSCNNNCGEDCPPPDPDETCVRVTVDALVKLQHIPVIQDNDPLVIGNTAALKLMAMAIQREEQERFTESAAFEAKAMAELEGERASYLGASTVMALQVQDRTTFGVAGGDEYGGFYGGSWWGGVW
jgi:hypothetical protein